MKPSCWQTQRFWQCAALTGTFWSPPHSLESRSVTGVAMRRPTKLAAFLLIGFLISSARVHAQLPAPNAAGVSAGHMHLMVRDPAAHKKIWVDLFGAQVVNSGSLELLKLPGIFLILGKAERAD